MLMLLLFIKHSGSEFDVVTMTRAKKLLILIGNPKVLEFMIQNANSKTRNTGLEFKLKTIIS